MHYSKLLMVLGLLCVSQFAIATNSSLETLPKQIVTLRVTGQFQNVYDATVSAILGRGLNIAHIDDAAKVLKQNHQPSNTQDPTFSEAKIIAFCSAKLSEQLVLENPNFIVLCPFTLSVYQLNNETNTVTLSYRNPRQIQMNSDTLKTVNNLYQGILEDATVWFEKSAK